MRTSILIIILSLSSAISCNRSSETSNIIGFHHANAKCDINGFPLDSTAQYFPPDLFYDTIPSFIDKNRVFRLYNFGSKKVYADRFDVDISSLRDTFEVEADSFNLKYRSYTLFKMQEPILYDHYLDKEIYRIIAFRSFHSPLLFRIEKSNNEITLFIKRLNKPIRYPFLVYSTDNDSLFYYTPDIAKFDTALNKLVITYPDKYKKLLDENKRFQDSIARVENVIDYELVQNLSFKVPKSSWDSLQKVINSAKFWELEADIALGYLQIDGSKWILEGHNKYGYQIRIIPSPHFKNYDFDNNFDTENLYANIFKYVFRISGLKNEYLY